MRAHIEALFTHDPRGRIVRVNEPAGKAAPRFYLGRTVEGREWRFRDDVDDELMEALESACRDEPGGEEFLLPPHGATRYETVLARAAPIQSKWAGPAYRFAGELPATAGTVVITGENSDLLRPHLPEWLDSVVSGEPFLASVNAGRAVSVCCSVRTTPAAHEAGVETAQAFRGRGYAAQVVAAWAKAVREIQRIPLYSTSWENRASLRVAEKLGLIRYGTDLHIT
jgi:RimJ/RimL family protein N-acetyltransferase